jgi:conjugal transfer/entry exclusion protein
MIFDLSKDKSLLNLLSKVDLDEETSGLVNSKASTSSIRKSLESNITSSNLIQYRKYILKAKEEEDEYEREEREESERREKEAHRETRQMTGDDGGYDDVHETEANQQKESDFEVESQDILTRRTHKNAFQHLNILKEAIPNLQKIKEEVNSNNDIMSRTYNNFTKKDSNFIIAWLAFLKKDPKSLLKKYDDLLTNIDVSLEKEEKRMGLVLLGKKWKNTDNEITSEDDSKLDIIVSDIQQELNDLLNTTFTIKDKKLNFYDVMVGLHHSSYNAEPTTSINKPQRKRNLQRFIDSLKDKKASPPMTVLSRTKQKLKELGVSLGALVAKKQSIENELAKLSKVGSSIDSIIADKLQQLTRGLNAVINEIKNLQANPKDYEKELRKILEDKIEKEQVKLQKIIEDLNRFDRFDETLQQFASILEIYDNEEPPQKILTLMTKASSLFIKMEELVVEVNALTDKAQEIIEDWKIDQLKSGKVIDSSNVDYDGMDTIDKETVAKVESFKTTYITLVNKVKQVLNQIENLM